VRFPNVDTAAVIQDAHCCTLLRLRQAHDSGSGATGSGAAEQMAADGKMIWLRAPTAAAVREWSASLQEACTARVLTVVVEEMRLLQHVMDASTVRSPTGGGGVFVELSLVGAENR
jgi:hypothetical protein